MTSRNFGNFLIPPPLSSRVILLTLCTVVTKYLTPSSLRPCLHLWTTPRSFLLFIGYFDLFCGKQHFFRQTVSVLIISLFTNLQDTRYYRFRIILPCVSWIKTILTCFLFDFRLKVVKIDPKKTILLISLRLQVSLNSYHTHTVHCYTT